jgi:hypothetical protein
MVGEPHFQARISRHTKLGIYMLYNFMSGLEVGRSRKAKIAQSMDGQSLQTLKDRRS